MGTTPVKDIQYNANKYKVEIHIFSYCSTLSRVLCAVIRKTAFIPRKINQRTNGPVNAHLISWPTKAQNIQNLENIW